MKKLNVKKSRLVELNRAQFAQSLGVTSVFNCGDGTESNNVLCKATSALKCPAAMAVDPYYGRVAAQAV